MAGMMTILFIVGALVGASLNSFSNSLPFYQTRIHEHLLDLRALLASKGIAVTDKILLKYVNPGVVMSLWKVDDTAAQELITSFYGSWLKSGNRRQTSRQAQEQIRDKYKLPEYWDALVPVGE
jgi:hypothetical protein